MKTPSNRAPSRSKSGTASDSDQSTAPNPVSVAAEAMVRQAIKAAKINVKRVLSPGSALIIKAEKQLWLNPIVEAARKILSGGTDNPDLIWLVAIGSNWTWSDYRSGTDVVELLANGKKVISITNDTRRLPGDLIRIADRVIKVPPPSWSIIREAAAAVGLLAEETIPDAKCRSIKPSELRLACRPGGENGAWVRRLRSSSGCGVAETQVAPLDRLLDSMIGRAMCSVQGGAGALQRSGTAFVIEVPSAEWAAPVERAMRHFLEDEKTERDDAREWPNRDDDDEDEVEVERLWMVRDGTAKDHKPDIGNNKVSVTLAAGGSVIGVAPDKKVLPADLVRAADHHVRIASPDWTLIREAILAATGQEVPDALSDAVCRVLSPSDYQLSMRPGENSKQWMKRLKAIGEIRLGGTHSGPTLDDLHGMGEATAWGLSLARDLAEYSAGRLPWSSVDRGCLLVGPPGTGKTTFARALSRSCDVPLVSGTLGEWQAHGDGHLGHCLRAMRATFDQARAAAPCILFIDELDAFGDRDKFPDRHADYSVQVVNAFLELLDGVGGREGVVVVGATNNPNRLDPAIIRSGRLDRMIRIGLPDEIALAGILRHHLDDDLTEVDLMPIARRALGMTGADIERIVRGARRRARTDSRVVRADDLLVELTGGDSDVPMELLLRRAYHEAGHAVAYSLLFPGSVVCASVRSGHGVGGMVETVLPSILTGEDALRRIMGALSGRAAEHVMTGAPSSGAGGARQSDLAQATAQAAAYYSTYGLDDGSLIWMGEETVDEVQTTLRADCSLRRRVMALLAEQYRVVHELLSRHRPAIRGVAEALVRYGALSGVEIETILGSVQSEVIEGGQP